MTKITVYQVIEHFLSRIRVEYIITNSHPLKMAGVQSVMPLALMLISSFFWSEVSGQFGVLPTDPGQLAAAAGMPNKMPDPSQIKPEDALKTCIPGWKENHTYYEDPKCFKYPEFCDYMPRPTPAMFAGFTEPFPCFLLSPEVIAKVRAAQETDITTMGKCMWDYVICFLNACYPGLDPRLLMHLIEIGKLKPKDGKMPELPVNAPGMPSLPTPEAPPKPPGKPKKPNKKKH